MPPPSRTVGGVHVRLSLARDGLLFNAIGFNMAERTTGAVIDMAFFPEMNEWNGSSSLQLRIKDLRPAE